MARRGKKLTQSNVEIRVDGNLQPLNAFQIHRPNGTVTTISGTGAVSVDVRDDALIILDEQGKGRIVFGRGQWVTVSAQPV